MPRALFFFEKSDFFVSAKVDFVHLNERDSVCLNLGMGIPVSIRRIHTAYIGEYLYFRYLTFLVIVCFFFWGGRLVSVPFFL